MTQPTSLDERRILSLFVAEGVALEKNVDGIQDQLTKWGMSPGSVSTGYPRSSVDNPKPYNVGPCSTLFLNIMRAAMGDAGLAQYFGGTSKSFAEAREKEKEFCRNCLSMYLMTTNHLCEEKTFDDRIGGTFFMFCRHRLREEVKHAYRDLDEDKWAEWGELSALTINFSGNVQNRLSDDEWVEFKLQWLEKLLVSGFPDLKQRKQNKPCETPNNPLEELGRDLFKGGWLKKLLGSDHQAMEEDHNEPHLVQGLLKSFEEKMPEATYNSFITKGNNKRRQMVYASPHFKKRVLKETREGRQAFLRSFLATAPNLANSRYILENLSFSEYEIREARERRY